MCPKSFSVDKRKAHWNFQKQCQHLSLCKHGRGGGRGGWIKYSQTLLKRERHRQEAQGSARKSRRCNHITIKSSVYLLLIVSTKKPAFARKTACRGSANVTFAVCTEKTISLKSPSWLSSHFRVFIVLQGIKENQRRAFLCYLLLEIPSMWMREQRKIERERERERKEAMVERRGRGGGRRFWCLTAQQQFSSFFGLSSARMKCRNWNANCRQWGRHRCFTLWQKREFFQVDFFVQNKEKFVIHAQKDTDELINPRVQSSFSRRSVERRPWRTKKESFE